jgi:hypothetical protein
MPTVIKSLPSPPQSDIKKSTVGFLEEEKVVEFPIMFEINTVSMESMSPREICDYLITCKDKRDIKHVICTPDANAQNIKVFVKSIENNTFTVNCINENSTEIKFNIRYISFY